MMTDKLISNIFIVFCLVVIFTMGSVAYNKANALPVVFFSFSTGDCKAVKNVGNTNYTCDKMPSRYTHTYVE